MDRYFLYRRMHSLSGVVPLGLFLMEHIFTNSFALYGPERFDAQVRLLHRLPFLPAIELLLILLPLAYHGIYGLYVTLNGQLNVSRYGYGRNWAYVLQRLTGVITLAFVGWHFWALRLQSMLTGNVATFEQVAAVFRGSPAVTTLYGLATVSAIYHFTNGLWGFAVDWGFAVGSRAQTVLARWCWGLFGAMTAATLAFMAAFIRL